MQASRAFRAAALVGSTILAFGGCNTDVIFPSVIDAAAIDPTSDAATLSMSAQSNLYRAVGSAATWGGLFSTELYATAVRQETVDIGRRVASSGVSDVAVAWNAIQRSLATNELAIQALAGGPASASDIHLARVYMNSGFSLILLAETYCEGDILSGPPLTTTQMLDTAIARFGKALTIGAAAAAAGVPEGTKIVNASNGGLARAHLQKKDYASAAAAAALVPAAFVFNALAVDDASNRALANGVFSYDLGGNLLVVPDLYRALNDPRVRWIDAGVKAQDPAYQYYKQQKHAGYASPIRITSGLEASYIIAEAKLQTNDPAPALTLIAARRAANGQAAFTGTGTPAILAELMDQRAREFWLEAKHLGDWRRNPTATPYVGVAGTPFYKPTQGNFGAATCLPVPIAEINSNPNWPKSSP